MISLACNRVQVSRWLIRQDETRLVGQRPGNGYPLALAAGELGRQVPGPVGKTHDSQQLFSSCPAGPTANRLTAHGHLDVFAGCQRWQEIVQLEDKTHHPGPKVIQVPDRGQILAVNDHPSPAGPVQATEHIEQRTLAAARRSHDSQHLPLSDLQIHAVEGAHLLPIAIKLGQSLSLNECFHRPTPTPASVIPTPLRAISDLLFGSP